MIHRKKKFDEIKKNKEEEAEQGVNYLSQKKKMETWNTRNQPFNIHTQTNKHTLT